MTKVKSHGNNVHDIMIAYVVSGGAQTNRSGKHKATLGPVRHVLHTYSTGNNGI